MTITSDDYDRRKLFIVSVLALFTIALSASLRAAVAGEIKAEILEDIDLARSATLIGKALGAAFLGFSITLFGVSPFLDAIGIKRIILGAALALVAGTVLTILAPLLAEGMAVYHLIWFGMLLNGVAWGGVEGAINPMTTSLYPLQKTHYLNVLHAWWPAGLIAGGLLGVVINAFGISWQFSLGLILLPSVIFAVMALKLEFPPTERAATGVSMGEMFAEIFRSPGFLIWFGAMFLTAATEIAPGQWVDLALTEKVGFRGILLLVYVSGLMFVMRHFAGALVRRLSSPGLLWCSSLLAAIGLFMLSKADGPVSALLGATVWGTGVCFMWPTMLATVSERYPRGGSWLIGLTGSAGALSIFFVLPQLGAYFDRVKLELAGGADALAALSAEALTEIENSAASASFQFVAILPLVLLLVFGAVWLHDLRSKKGSES